MQMAGLLTYSPGFLSSRFLVETVTVVEPAKMSLQLRDSSGITPDSLLIPV